MKKFTFLWCLLLCLTTAMNGQNLQTKSSINDLLSRYSQLGTQSGSVSEHFTKEEQQMLRVYFKNQKPEVSTNGIKGVNLNSSDEGRKISPSSENRANLKQQSPLFVAPSQKDSSEEARKLSASPEHRANLEQRTPLFVAPQVLTAEDEAEILADEIYRANLPSSFSSRVINANRNTQSDITPTAGNTETFNPATGDHFFDPGGPGGANTDGVAGNYPNCGCDTQTTLAGVSEIEFQEFGVNGTFDYLRIYDGTDATGTVLYDNSDTGANSDEKTLADLIASNGSASFTATSGNFFFFFHASAVVNWLGWDVEIIDASGGGGGGPFPDPYCAVTFSYIEPITLVDVAGISNVSDPDSTVAHEDFTAISGNMEEGMTYPIALEGNTEGSSYTNSFTVFIDWNQDGTFDNASERYEIGTITGSTGTDGQQATGDIVVPAGVTAGTTRMRVVKRYLATFATDACTPGTSFGQAEDYSINVTAGGGGGGTVCDQTHPYAAGTYAGIGSSVDSAFKTAVDIELAMGEDFVLETIEVPFLTFAPTDPPTTAKVVYYKDDSGLPGAMIGSETVVPTILSSGPWVTNTVADEYMTSLSITPFTFNGDATMTKKYWIEISMGTATNQQTVFWEGTLDTPVEGEPAAQFDGGTGTWSVPDPLQEAIYVFSGNCEPMGGGGTGGPCATTGPSNNFEDGKSFTKNLGRIVANDLTVADGEDMLLESITFTAFIGAPGSGVNADNVDVIIYKDNGSGEPGSIFTSQMSLVPDSQVVIGDAFGYQAWSIELDIADVNLPGQTGDDTTYWIGLSLEPTDGTNTFWENSTAGLIGLGEAYDDGLGGGFIVEPLEGVYTFDGTCSPIGGGGGPGPLTTVYGINNFNQDLIGFGTATPGDIEVFGTSPITVNFENAGAIDPANPTTGYVLDNVGKFYSFDVTTGLYTSLGTIAGDWTGLEYDRASGILYGISGTDLYTVDPVGLSATLVGSLGLASGALPVAIAIDGAGVGYTYDLVDDTLYSVDLATGATTLVGSIGFDANYGQGMCYDPTTDMVYMAAFNSGTFAAEWRSVDLTTGATTLIGNLVDPDAQVGWASVGETLPPPACPKPTNLTVTNIGETTADLNWDAEPNAGNGYVWYVFEEGANPATDTPVDTGTTPSGTTTAMATGLTNGTSYDFYVVADCDTDGLSNLAGPITFETEITPPACGGKFYDNGGPNGNYANNSNDTVTINPDVTGNVVTVTFTSFNVEATWDALYVYDGPDATFPIISSGNPATNGGFPAGGYYGTDIIGPFTSTDASGALTFVFRSEGSVNKTGWEADVTCTTPPPPNDMIANSIDVDEVGFPYTDPAVETPFATTEDGNPNGCDLTGANGVWYNFVAAGDGTAVATIVTPAGASSVTFYTAPNESAVETDLTLVSQNSNQCGPGTTASINTVAGQAYYVFVLNTGSATDITIDGTNLGVSDNTIAGFTFYPNPSTDILNLRSVDNIESVSIYNMLGQQVISNKINASSSQLNVSSLSTGTYLMKVIVNGQTGTYRVLKN